MHTERGMGKKFVHGHGLEPDLPSVTHGLCFISGMPFRKSLFASLALCCLAALPCLAAGKKEPAAAVSFHLEGDATDNPKMIFQQATGGRMRTFSRTPEVNSKDIRSFAPFPSDAGDYGVMFVLKSSAAKRLAAVTNAAQGRFLVARLNGRIVDGVQIDKSVEDGKLVIWKGATMADIALLDESFPRIGQEGKKKKAKKETKENP
jgi:hypothetical protein